MATAPLIERDDELACLRARVDAALAGVGSTVAVEGAAGIGKSSLLSEAARFARDGGMRVLTARGGELEQEFGYGLTRQLFERELARVGSEQRRQLLAGPARFCAPALGLAGDGLPLAAEEHATLHGLYWLSANLAAERPLLLVIDDAHWADRASQRFVVYVARRAEELALLVLYAARSGEGACTDLPSEADVGLVRAHLRPRPLSERGTAALVSQLLDDPHPAQIARAFHAVTAGNPFLVHELAREVTADGFVVGDAAIAARIASIAPRSITRAIVMRMQRLGREATEPAFAVAVVGTHAHLRHVADVAGLDRRSAGEAADTLARAGILAAQRPLQFVHPIVRSAVYAEIPPARRAASHRRAAELLEREGAPADTLAAHLISCECGGDPWVVERLRAAAAVALQRGAPDAACAYLERALDEPPLLSDRPALLLALGSAELHAGRGSAVGRLREALANATETRVRVDAAQELTLAITANDRAVEAVEMLDATIVTLAKTDPAAAMHLDALLICIAQVDSVTAKLASERLARYGDDLRGETTVDRLLLASLAYDCANHGSPQRAVRFAERALTGDLLLAEQRPDSPSFELVALTFAYADQLDRAEDLLDRAIEDARTRGSLLGYPIATGCRAFVLVRQGRLAEAEAEARSALEPCLAEGWRIGVIMLVPPLLDAMVERASFAACDELLRDTGHDGEAPTSIIGSTLLHNRGHLRLAEGDATAALRDFDELCRRDDGAGLVNPGAYNARASAALAHAKLGHHDAALEFAQEGLAAARRWGAPSPISFALRALAAAQVNNDDRIELLCEAAASMERTAARYEHARALTDLGSALRRGGQRRDARAPLRAALDIAQRSGATRLAGRARYELVATGARPRRAATTGADALTPCERRVAGMAADGLTNRDIAQALFVTVRTVETHLSHVYTKLDLHSRDHLAVQLRQDDAADRVPRTPAGAAGTLKDT